MNIVGANLGRTTFGKTLKDGALCIIKSHHMPVMLVEERFSGTKHDGGYERAIRYARQKGMLEGTDMVVVSSCCEPQLNELSAISDQFGCDAISVNHHLSHAYQVFVTSGFDEALIVVADAGGNVLEEFDNRRTDWWAYKREQVSVFYADYEGIRLIERLFDSAYEIGFGEFWRYMTYLCGFDSSNKAAKVMELAGFGSPLSASFFFDEGGPKIQNDPQNKHLGEQILLNYVGYLPNMETFSNRVSVAAWAQKSLERAYELLLEGLQKRVSTKKLCLAGGVALNCKLVQQIRRLNFFEEIFSGFMPSDSGQALGNALFGHVTLGNKQTARLHVQSPFLAPNRTITKAEIGRVIGPDKHQYLVSGGFQADAILGLLANGFVIGTCVGRGEVGARALGNTSLLASPYVSGIKERLNHIKARPDYTPVASAVDQATYSRLFGKDHSNLHYMAELAQPQQGQSSVPRAIIHVDKSVRVQLIDENEDSYLHKLATAEAKTKIFDDPFILLNTSLNLAERPMPHSPEQAICQFKNMDADGLITNNHTLIRKKSARFEAQIEKQKSDNFDFFELENIFQIKQRIEETYGKIEFRENFSLYENYIQWMQNSRKITTIRFIENGLSLPVTSELPIIMTTDFKQSSIFIEYHRVKIYGVKVKRFCDLNQVDAQRDGFEKTSHLKRTLSRIYPKITDNSVVSISFIELLS